MTLGPSRCGLADRRATPPGQARRALRLREEFERLLRAHVEREYRAHLAGGAPPGPFLEPDRLSWERWRENEPGLPGLVFQAYAFYVMAIQARDLGSVRIHRRELEGGPVYLVRVTTDGDSGWLELYDAHGLPLGAGRTYLELIAWDRLDAVRAQAQSLELPPALRDAQTRTLWGRPHAGR
jgi:hypothetical protein